MGYPQVVPDRVCITPCHVTIYKEGINRNGSPIVAVDKDLKCCYREKQSSWLQGQTGQTVTHGHLLFNGDIAPDVPVISKGKVRINGVDRSIADAQRGLNLDGTVNFTRLILE